MLKQRNEKQGKLKFFSRSVFIVTALLIIIGLSSFLLLKFYGSPTDNEIALAKLNKIYKDQRPLESRISQFEYAPTINTSSDKVPQIDKIKLDEIEEIISKNKTENNNAETLHNSGRFYLAKKEFYTAVKELEESAKFDPDNSQIKNDLGVAYFEISKSTKNNNDGKSLENMGNALEKFDQAISLDLNNLEAHFNQAIALQEIKLQNQAKEAFRVYLEKDTDSRWAFEAKENLEKLESNKLSNKTSGELLKDFQEAYRNKDEKKAYKIVSDNRELIKSKVIPLELIFLFLEADNNTQKQEYLSALKYVGMMEKEKTGDSYFSKIANYYSFVSEETGKVLLTAQKAVKNGYKLSLRGDYKKALDEFSSARGIFLKANNKWEAGLSDYWIAYCDARIDNIEKSTQRLEKLLDYCKKNDFKWLAAHTTYWLSVNAQAIKELSTSIEYAIDALKFSEDTFDFYNTQKSLSRLADLNLQVNRLQKSYFYLKKSLKMSNLPESSVRQKGRDLNVAVRLFYSTQFYKLAGDYQKELLHLHKTEIKDASFEHIGLANLGNIYAAQRKFDEAIEFAKQGKKVSELLIDEKARKKANGYAILQIANLERRKGNCGKSISNYKQATKIFSSMELRSWVFESSKGHLICNIEKNNKESVEKELPELLKLFEENRKQITEEQNRNSFFDKEQSIYDLAIGYEIEQGNFEKAFDYSERSRSRSLLDLMKGGIFLSEDKRDLKITEVTKPQALNELRSKIPAEVQMIQYAVLDKKLVIWLFSKDQFKGFTSEILSEDIELKISDFLTAIRNIEQEKQQKLSREFYKLLIKPLENDLDDSKEIYIVPDKKLFYLPFAALISDKTDRYLIEDYKLAYSPSTNVFLAASENASAKNSEKAEKLLSIGNPTFSLDNSKWLPDLPNSAKEAKEIIGFYRMPTLLLERKATKEAFLKSIDNSDIIHFAGHYIVNEHSPLRSSFLVARSGEDNNRLANYELLEENFKRPKLIVLSACQTAIEQYYKGEGMTGAGRTFLALGIPLVVASHWQVDDSATADLMANFHKFRKTENLSSISALRRSQLEMLNNENESFHQPFYWAGFLTLGGYAEF